MNQNMGKILGSNVIRHWDGQREALWHVPGAELEAPRNMRCPLRSPRMLSLYSSHKSVENARKIRRARPSSVTRARSPSTNLARIGVSSDWVRISSPLHSPHIPYNFMNFGGILVTFSPLVILALWLALDPRLSAVLLTASFGYR